MEQFTASEVRETAIAICAIDMPDTGRMLHAYADRLEADEKAVPVAAFSIHVTPVGHTIPNVSMNQRLPVGYYEVFLRSGPSDAERLAEALERTARHRAAADRIDPDQWRSVLYRWEDRALAAHSAQAQPPTASVLDEDDGDPQGIYDD